LNAARWDLKASILEYVMHDPKQVWPDRFGVDVKKTPMLTNIFRRLVSVCLRHGAAPIGGMATALPHKDEEVNKAASASIAVKTNKQKKKNQKIELTFCFYFLFRLTKNGKQQMDSFVDGLLTSSI